MAQASYGTITITDTTDLTTYIRYAKRAPLQNASDFQTIPDTNTHYIAVLNIPSNETIPTWDSNDWKWSEFIGTDGLSVKNTRVLYYLNTSNSDAPQVTSSTSIASTDITNQWTSLNPTYVTNATYWTCLEVTLSDNMTKSWSAPTKDLGLTQTAKDTVEIKSIATHAEENAEGAMSQAGSNINSVIRLWYAQATSTPIPTISAVVTDGAANRYNAWSNVRPTDNEAYPYYFYCDQTITGSGVASWSTVTLDTSTLSKYEIEATNVRTKNFFKGKDNSYDGWFASGRSTNNGLDEADATTYQYNARFSATHVTLGYNKTPVIDLNGSNGAIDIYHLPTISNGLVTAAGTLAMQLGASSLQFFTTDSNGIAREAINLGTSGLKFFNFDGTTNNIIANFGSTVQIGKTGAAHLNITSNSLELSDSTSNTFFKVRDAVNENGQVIDTFNGDGDTVTFYLTYTAANNTYTVTQNDTVVSPSKDTETFTFSTAPALGDIIVATYSVTGNNAKGYDFGIRLNNAITGAYSVIEGYNTQASGNYSHAEGYETIASGINSHAEGYETIASGRDSHAEGWATIASSLNSHAEGSHTIASGDDSHAEGSDTISSGLRSHAEGTQTEAQYINSHAQGENTISRYRSQTALGTYNVQDSLPSTAIHKSGSKYYGKYAVIIGNGTDGSRSNALTIDWNGNVRIAGKVYINGTYDLSNATELTGGGGGGSGTITSVTTTAGAHTTINVSSGAASFNVPTTAAHVSALALSGGTLTGRLTLNTMNTAQVNVRPGHDSYDGIMSYQTAGNEAWIFSTKNAVTSFMFVNGEDSVTNAGSERWKSLTPGLQIKNNCVSIGSLIGDGVTPTYKLDVNGTVNCPAFNTDSNNYLYTKSWLKVGVTADNSGWTHVWVHNGGNATNGGWLYNRPKASFASDIISAGITKTTATLSSSGWSNNAQTVTVSGVTASNTVSISPDPSSYSNYVASGIYCSAQAADSLTFTCVATPTAAITVNVVIF